MISHKSESWDKVNWKTLQKTLFRLQTRIYKAVCAGDKRKANNLQKLLLRSYAARMIAIRQVTQLNAGKKTAGIDGKKALKPKERFELAETLKAKQKTWKHSKLREIPIPKKDGSTRMLKVPTIADRAWQCLIKLALDPAHEATFHARSYGFRVGRSAQDAQKILQINLNSNANGIDKRVIELDIEKCFDRIAHKAILDQLIAPQSVKQGIFHCLKAGTSPEFPDQGTPQGGVVSPLLANIALNGIEAIHPSVRYADDMIFFLKPKDEAEKVLDKIKKFLAARGMKISEKKTKVTATTSGFDFLGWNFKVQSNGKFKSRPSKDNYLAMRKKVKAIVNCPNISAEEKSKKLAPIIRGWRNYHKHCAMDKARDSLWAINHRTWKVFNKEESLNKYQTDNLVLAAFPTVSYSENKFVNVKGGKSPYDGDLTYWGERNSKLYDGTVAETLKKQHHSCGHCGLKLTSEQRVHLHHIDCNHKNWKRANLMAVHESCHDYIHMAQRETKTQLSRKLGAGKPARPDFNERCGG